MKISKRKKLDILFIFVVLLLIEIISLITYHTVVLAKTNTENSIQIQVQKGYENLSEDEEKILNYVNKYRKENGLKELKPLSNLQQVAKLKAQDLVQYEYFSHTSDRLGTPFEMLKQNKINYKLAGENLAGNINSEKAVKAWINSPTHKENILEQDFEYTGICVIESPIYGKVFVQIFIKL